MTRDERKYCAGCTLNFYNGFNKEGILECPKLRRAKLVLRKQINIHNKNIVNESITLPICFHMKGFTFFTIGEVGK